MMTVKTVESASKANVERLHALADALDAAGRDDLDAALKRVQDAADALKARQRTAAAAALLALEDAYSTLEGVGGTLDALAGIVPGLTDEQAEAVACYPASVPPQLPAPVPDDADPAAADPEGYGASYVRAAEAAAALPDDEPAPEGRVPPEDDRETVAPGDEHYYYPREEHRRQAEEIERQRLEFERERAADLERERQSHEEDMRMQAEEAAAVVTKPRKKSRKPGKGG